MAAILDARGLHKNFGAVTAASDINAAIEKDSVVGLIGTNGAGKTTFINMITGYLKPDRGRIHYEGRDITELAPRDVTRLGICRSFQIPQLYASLTVFENMMIGIGVVLGNAGRGGFFSRGRPLVPGYDLPAEEVAERIFERFGLAEYRDRNAQVLPGGVRKLLDIALTMVAKPRILLLDEPTSGVSAQEKFAIMEMIMKAVRAEGITVLFVEHDMEVVSRFAERVLAFYDGRIIADAAPEIALADPEVKRYVVGGCFMLKIENLNVAIQSVQILRDVSLALPTGTMAGLIGRNGAGKTTLMKSIMGILKVSGGSIRFNDADLLATPTWRRTRMGIGYMPEDRRLIPDLTVEENLLLPAWAAKQGDAARRLEKVCRLIPELRGFATRKGSQLSGGQQKMVAIGRALMCGDKLLLLDEPFEGVAPALAQRLVEVVASLKREGMSVILSESDLQHSERMVDRVIVIDRGAVSMRN